MQAEFGDHRQAGCAYAQRVMPIAPVLKATECAAFSTVGIAGRTYDQGIMSRRPMHRGQ